VKALLVQVEERVGNARRDRPKRQLADVAQSPIAQPSQLFGEEHPQILYSCWATTEFMDRHEALTNSGTSKSHQAPLALSTSMSVHSWHIQVRVTILGPYLKHRDNPILIVNFIKNAPVINL